MTDEEAPRASLRADAQDTARVYQAARDLHLTYRAESASPAPAARLSLLHLLACCADAPLPVSVLSPEAVAAVRMPELPAERVSAELRALPEAAGDVPCVRADPAALAASARELTDDQRTRLSVYAAALLDHALLRSPDGPVPDLLAPHVTALLWRSGGDPARAAARRLRDAYESRGWYAEALPFAVRIAEPAAGAALADGLALGRIRSGCGDFGEAEAVLRPVLAQAERAAEGCRLSLTGHTGPSIAEMLRGDPAGPFTGGLSSADCHALADVADVQHALADALYGLRRYAECERLLFAAGGLRWRVLGAPHPAYLLAQLHRARVLGRRRLWHEALGLVQDVLSYQDRAELDRSRPREDALLRLAHAQVMTGLVRSLCEEGASRSRRVGMFPAPVVRFLDRTVGTNPRPEKVTWDEARTLAEEAVRACDGAFGPGHPHTRAARALLERPRP
ncbi:hypothetical protein [Streptomyces sp. NPDC053427]|uniref:hypothetical protein n=1 Tax=Streptomyces sp. NPDC053427 TaxID=3365701 RepID=UPI0037D0A238